MSDETEAYSTPAETGEAAAVESETLDVIPEPPSVSSNDVVLASTLHCYQQLLTQLEANRQAIHNSRRELAQVRQQIRELSAITQRDPSVDDDADSHGLHTSKVAAQYDDCGSIITYAEQIRRHVYDNSQEAEDLLSPITHSVNLLKLRVRYIRLLESLLEAQEQGLRLEIQQRNADACIWQLADILKV